MTQQPQKKRYQPRSRRLTRRNGLPHLAAKLPPDFRCPTHVNAFIYDLAVEVAAGRVESRTAATLGYLSQLAIQTLPLIRLESDPDDTPPVYQFVSTIPRPNYSRFATPAAVPTNAAPSPNDANTSREGIQR